MDTKEKPLIAFALFKNPPFIRVVKEPAQLEEEVHCRVCGKALKSAASLAAGIGPVCARKEKAELAPKVLKRRGKKTKTDPNQLDLFTEKGVRS